jgi:hypothetical protein
MYVLVSIGMPLRVYICINLDNTYVYILYQEYIILGVNNGLLYLMKRHANSYIVLRTMDVLICISTSLIHFVAAPLGKCTCFIAKDHGRIAMHFMTVV